MEDKDHIEEQKKGCLIALAIIMVYIIISVFMQSPSCKKTLSGKDNGHKWHKTNYEVRRNLCKNIARRIGRHDWEHYYEAIDAHYNTVDPKILDEAIATIAAMASVMPSEEKQRNNLANAISEGKVSYQEEAIYNYLQSMWDFYKARDGKYIPEKHDDLVFSKTGKKFGLSNAEVLKVFDKVDKARLGMD